ncbi:hypothetical protein EsDP_00000657 [Epichloe bromicola]|uniref:Adenosine deaminase domain-containing protein n=1 Tax=Epichloe bromicola TaxID=79588 RepID=A0ABQ0CFJ7_9HYPO
MSLCPGQLSQQAREALKDELISNNSDLILRLPKVELHVHIEGTLTPELRWKLAQRHGVPPRFGGTEADFESVQDLRKAHDNVVSSAQIRTPEQARTLVTFSQAYYSGFEYLKTKNDFFDLAMNYFQLAATMNVRYCEPFFDAQGHTSRGVAWEDMMEGFREAQERASGELNVHSSWIMCILRDQSPESAMDHYKEALRYKDMIIGIGLDSNELNRPPNLFEEVYTLARKDGFKITAHCDVGVEDTHEHIRQVASTIAGTGLDRLDHGLHVADERRLLELVAGRSVPMTICPWAYLRRETYDSIAERLRLLFDAGIKMCISSDSPVYMDESWVTHNLLLAQKMGGFTDAEMVQIARSAVDMSWAKPAVKKAIDLEIEAMYEMA